MEDNKDLRQAKRSHEIDVVELLKKTIKEPKLLWKFIAVAGVIGVVIALTTPKSYTANAVLAPEISGSTSLSGNLSDIASSFGIDIGSGGGMDAIYPEIYPEVIMSPDFLKDLMEVPVRLKEDDTPRTYYQHVTSDASIALLDWPKVLISWALEAFTKDDSAQNCAVQDDDFKFTKKESKFCEMTGKCIACVVDKKTSIISISMADQDPLVAAIMVDTIQHRLQTYITEYRTKKSRADYKYFTMLYEEAQKAYEDAQNKYASYCDTHQNTLWERFQVKRDALENDMQLAFQMMNQMSTQKEAAKAKIQENTPAFTVLSRPVMPYKASSTPRSVIVLLFIVLGICVDVVWVNFIRDSIRKWRKR